MADVSVEARERMKTEYIREDRTVEGWYIETHYTPCKGIADANGYLRVLVDEEGYDTETRILHETLNGIGWVKSAALSANNQERAEAGAFSEAMIREAAIEFNQHSDRLSTLDRMRFVFRRLAATSTKPADEVIDMALCEAHALVLREGQPYTFRRVGDCEKCAKMSADAKEAYGEVEHVEAAKHVCTPQPPTTEGQTKPKCVIYLDADQIDVAQFYRAKGFQHLPTTPTMTGAEIRACGWKKNNYQMYIDVTPMVPVGDTEAIALVDGMKFFCIPPATW